MMSRRSFLAAVAASAAASSAAAQAVRGGEAAQPQGLVAAPPQAAPALNAFALDFHHRLAGDGKDNLTFSPFSIHAALAMTSAGARAATLEQMATVLRLKDVRDPHAAVGRLLAGVNASAAPVRAGQDAPFELVTANALWGIKGYPYHKEFLDLVNAHYGGGFHEVDYVRAPEEARRTINAWVEKQTRDKIKELIPAGILNALTRLVLTNAIYFKSAWAEPFDKGSTREGAFTTLDGRKADVPLMRADRRRIRYAEADGLQAVAVPYVAGRLAMIVVLPRKADGLPALEKDLAAGKSVAGLLASFRPRPVNLALPRFKTRTAARLNDVLVAMGMRDAFDRDRADFSGISTAEGGLYITDALHQAMIDVDEAGTEAAAATAVIMGLRAAPRPEEPVEFIADRPFLYMIRHEASGAILFMGRVTNPAA